MIRGILACGNVTELRKRTPPCWRYTQYQQNVSWDAEIWKMRKKSYSHTVYFDRWI